jgi:hypothetical protein
LLELAQILEDLPSLDQDDIWTYNWASPFYIPMKAYVCLIGSQTIHPVFHWLLRSSTQKKHKVFFWLLPKDRLSTINILRRKNQALPSFDCVLCQTTPEETVEHLFLHYPFAQSHWALLHLQIPQSDSFQILSALRTQLNVPFFMDIIIILSWSIWTSCNKLIFEGQQPGIPSVKEIFQ